MTIPLIPILVALVLLALALWAIRTLVPSMRLPPIVGTVLYYQPW